MGTLKELKKIGVRKSLVNEALKGIEENTRSTEGKIRYNGAVVTGTAEELNVFNILLLFVLLFSVLQSINIDDIVRKCLISSMCQTPF